jgi:hypothetical protein
VGSEQFILTVLPFVPIGLCAARRVWIFAVLTALPEPRATAAGNERNSQQPPYELKAVFPRLGTHLPFFLPRFSLVI